MTFTRFLFGNTSRSQFREKRELNFSPNWAEINARRQGLEKVPAYRKTAKKAARNAHDIAQNEQDNAFAGRGDAPKVDLDYAGTHMEIGIENIKDAENDSELSLWKRKAATDILKLMHRYRERRSADGKVLKGLVFDFDGSDFTVVTGDPKFIGAAINFAQDKINEFGGRPRAELRGDGLRESKSSFDARVATQNRTAAYQNHVTAGMRHENVAIWEGIKQDLQRFESEFQMHEDIRKQLDESPDKIREIENDPARAEAFESFKQKRPRAYLKVVRDAAKRDVTILEGREEEFVGKQDTHDAAQMYDFVNLLNEVGEEQVAAVLYTPDRIKRAAKYVELTDKRGKGRENILSGLPIYRNQMAELANEQPSVALARVFAEYAQYWQTDVAAAGAHPEQSGFDAFRGVLENAIAADGSLFYRQPGRPHWRDIDDSLFRSKTQFTDFLKGMDVTARVRIIEHMTAGNMNEVASDYTGGLYAFIADLLETAESDSYNDEWAKFVVSAVVDHQGSPNLIKIIQGGDGVLYDKFMHHVRQTGNDRMRELMGLPTMIEDEDNAADLLADFTAALALGGADAERAFREYGPMLEKLPPFILHTEKHKQTIMKMVETRGELFAKLPESWRNDKEIVLWAVTANASAFKHCSSAMRNDREVVYAAMVAEHRDGNGNMHWVDVGDHLKYVLKEYYGIEGIPTDQRLLDQIILKLKYEVKLDADKVHSPFDSWNAADRGDKSKVVPMLLRHTDKPEYLHDVPVMRADIDGVRNLIARSNNWEYFKHVDHEAMNAADAEKYRALVVDAVAQRSDFAGDMLPALQEDPDFVLSLADESPSKLSRILGQIDAQHIRKPEFIRMLIAWPPFDGNSEALVSFMESNIGSDLAGFNLLQLLPDGLVDDENARNLVRAFFKLHPDQGEALRDLPTDLRHNEEFILQLLHPTVGHPVFFEFIDHDHWVAEDMYQDLMKSTLAMYPALFDSIHDSLKTDIATLVEIAKDDTTKFASLVSKIPASKVDNTLVESIIRALEKAPFNMDNDDIAEFMNDNVFKGDLDVKAQFEFMFDAQLNDQASVLGALENAANTDFRGAPSKFKALPDKFRSDTTFIDLVRSKAGFGIKIFPHVLHEKLLADNRDYYVKLLKDAYADDPKNLQHAPAELQEDIDFLWEEIAEKNIHVFTAMVEKMDPRLRAKPEFLQKILDLIESNDADMLLDFVEDRILPDVDYTGIGVLKKVLEDNPSILMRLLEKDSRAFLAEQIPASMLADQGLLEDIILLMQTSDTLGVRLLLQKAPTAARAEFIKTHPRLILNIFQEDPYNLVPFVGEDMLSVTLLRHALAYYSQNESEAVLFDALAMKPGVVEGVLLTRPDLFVNADGYTQHQLVSVLGNDVINVIIKKYEELDEEKKKLPRKLAKKRLQSIRQDVLALSKLFTNKELAAMGHKKTVYQCQCVYDCRTRRWYNVQVPKEVVVEYSFAQMEKDFKNLDTDTADIKDIDAVIKKHYTMYSQLKKALTVDHIVKDMKGGDLTLKDAVLAPVPKVEIPGVGETKPMAQHEHLFTVYDRISGLKTDKTFTAEKKAAVLARLRNQMVNSFNGLLEQMKNGATEEMKVSAAHKVQWYLYNKSNIWMPARPGGLDKQKLSNLREQARGVIERAKKSPLPVDIGEPLPEDKEAYYNLTKKARTFVKTMEMALGVDKFTFSLGLSKMDPDTAKETIKKITEKMGPANSVSRPRVNQNFKALGGNESTPAERAMTLLTIAAELSRTHESARILKAIGTADLPTLGVEQYIKLIGKVSLALPLSISSDNHEITDLWEAKKLEMEEEAKKAADAAAAKKKALSDAIAQAKQEEADRLALAQKAAEEAALKAQEQAAKEEAARIERERIAAIKKETERIAALKVEDFIPPEPKEDIIDPPDNKPVDPNAPGVDLLDAAEQQQMLRQQVREFEEAKKLSAARADLHSFVEGSIQLLQGGKGRVEMRTIKTRTIASLIRVNDFLADNADPNDETANKFRALLTDDVLDFLEDAGYTYNDASGQFE